MYPSRFEYYSPSTVEEAISVLERFDGEAKIVAGGQSLIPLMKLRFVAPAALVDINAISGLARLDTGSDGLEIGALVRHVDCERSDLLKGRYRVLGDAAPQISDPIIRNRGTLCGSLAHADPQGDWGAVMLAARGEVTARGPDGTRTIAIDDLLAGPFTSSLGPAEVITSARVADPGPRTGGTYLKLERKVGDYATAAVAAQVTLDDGKVASAGIGLTGVGGTNLRADAAEEVLVGSEPTDDAIAEAARLAAEAARPQSDVRGSAEYKRNAVAVFTRRALAVAVDAARAG